jgi:hypothetical protein
MSIPLDRLYHYIESIAKNISDDILIYRFYPHGSKKIEDLNMLTQTTHPLDTLTKIHLVCHDQEPLNYNLYADCIRGGPGFARPGFKEQQHRLLSESDLNLFKVNLRDSPHNIYDKCLLLHSEVNSIEIEKYANDQFIPVYYWNHAILARDWYRYAQHIKKSQATSTKKFLVYNRAWTGTREYRLKLADLLVDHHLVEQCQTSFSFTDHDTNVHYSQHALINPVWKPSCKFESHYNSNEYPATSSADFDINDYQSTDIELVLETLFDDSRIQLTEKSLRPIALEQPFILAAPAGSLKYLKKYGFKTFDSVINESYDDIVDPAQRLAAITKLMLELNQMSRKKYQQMLCKLNKIAKYNKKYFFSNTFMNVVKNELTDNLSTGIDQLLSANTYERFLKFRTTLMNNKDLTQWKSDNLPQSHIQYYNQVYDKISNLKHQ